MDDLKVIMITTKKEYKQWLAEEIESQNPSIQESDFENDRINKRQAATLIGKSIPTLNKLIKSGELKVYGFGKRGKYLLKSEVIEALRNSNN